MDRDPKNETPADDDAVRQTVRNVLVDPDSPDHGHNAPPPQTIDAEPQEKRR